jgi:cysteine desulfurase / selenocysteine lyase
MTLTTPAAADFPVLSQEKLTYLDSAATAQTARPVIEAMDEYYTEYRASIHRGVYPLAARATDAYEGARERVAAFTGSTPGETVFTRNATEAINLVAYSWGRANVDAGDLVVVTQMEHHSNLVPWQLLCAEKGAELAYVPVTDGGLLDLEALGDLLARRPKLVAVAHVSNVLGTINPVAEIAERAHAAGAVVVVDGAQAVPHLPVDVAALGADFFACSPYKFGGPHCGVVAADPALLEILRPDKLVPSSDAVPERFELGTLPYELIAGTTAAIDFLASLDPADAGSRRERVVGAWDVIGAHEDVLRDRIEHALLDRPDVTVWSRSKRRTSTLYFSVDGQAPADVHAELGRHGISVSSGHCYAWEPCHRLGLGPTGAVRVGLAPYTNDEDVHRLLSALTPSD